MAIRNYANEPVPEAHVDITFLRRTNKQNLKMIKQYSHHLLAFKHLIVITLCSSWNTEAV